jgi:hypothetical protein
MSEDRGEVLFSFVNSPSLSGEKVKGSTDRTLSETNKQTNSTVAYILGLVPFDVERTRSGL